jgi:hypothetical protein
MSRGACTSRDVFPVPGPNRHPDAAANRACGVEREQHGGIARVVVGPHQYGAAGHVAQMCYSPNHDDRTDAATGGRLCQRNAA